MSLPAFLNPRSDTMRTLPIAVLYITDKCNSRCLSCDYWRSGQKEISMDLARQLAGELAGFGTRYVLLSGGEPLQHPQWAAIAALFKASGARVGLATSGILLAKNAGAVADCIDEVYISLDGATRESYRAMRGVDGLELVGQGMAKIGGRLPMIMRTTLQRGNYAELPALIRLSKSWGATRHSFLAVDTHSRAAFARGETFDRSMSLRAEDLDPFARVLDQTEREFDADFSRGYLAESKAKLRLLHRYFAALLGVQDPPPVRCNAPSFSAVIEADGSVRPCFFLPCSGLFNGASIAEAVNTPSGKELRRQQRSGLRPECLNCVCPAYRGRVDLLGGI